MRILALTFFVTVVWLAGCSQDAVPITCRPTALQRYGDSLVYRYNDQGKLYLLDYYDVLGRINKHDEFTLDSKGRLALVTKVTYPIAGGSVVDAVHTLSYGDSDLPVSLNTQTVSGVITTTFTHDNLGRLIEASTSTGSPAEFLGSTRYEYDDNGNIPKVYYKLMINSKLTEVLARENLSFDDKFKFYAEVPELKACQEYVYSYLPNKNNCTSAKVYYYSYKSRFVTPLSINFQTTYNERGLIKSIQDDPPASLNSSEVLFERVIYTCN